MRQRETDKLDRVKVSSGPSSDIDAQSPPYKRRSSVSSKDGDRSQFICCFCNEADSQENLVAAGTLYAKKSKSRTKQGHNQVIILKLHRMPEQGI